VPFSLQLLQSSITYPVLDATGEPPNPNPNPYLTLTLTLDATVECLLQISEEDFVVFDFVVVAVCEHSFVYGSCERRTFNSFYAYWVTHLRTSVDFGIQMCSMAGARLPLADVA
jgi:hypothetical protein